MCKKIMFIGAGKYQVAGIQKAKETGLFVIATDGNPDAPGLKIADSSYVIDVRDQDANLKVAREHSIDAVLSVASDVSLKAVAEISQKLNLPGIKPDVAECSTDKELMRSAFRNEGVPSPESYRVSSYEDLLKKATKIGYPVVIKPADNAGSRGVKMVTQKTELKEAYENALKNSRKGKVLVEEFMEGVEISKDYRYC